MDLAGAAHLVGVGREERLACAVDRRSRWTEDADGFRPEVAVGGVAEVEDVEEQVEMATFAGQRDVFHEANVQVEEGRLPQDVSRSDQSVQQGAVIPVVGVVLGVEADDGRVGQARTRHQMGLNLSPHFRLVMALRLKLLRTSNDE